MSISIDPISFSKNTTESAQDDKSTTPSAATASLTAIKIAEGQAAAATSASVLISSLTEMTGDMVSDGGTSETPTNEELDLLVHRLRTPVPDSGSDTPLVVVKDRLYRLRKYPQCFVARDFVRALLNIGYCQTRREAVIIGKMLCRRGIIHHVVDDHDFRDGYYFFRWYADELRSARSMSIRKSQSANSLRSSSSSNTFSIANETTEESASSSFSTEKARAEALQPSLSRPLSVRDYPSTITVDVSSPRATFRNSLGGKTIPFTDGWPLRDLGPLAAALRQAVNIRDRTYHLRVYPNCFLGKDAISWLVSSGTTGSREEAAVIGSAMITAGYFHHVVDDHALKDQALFYRFYCDEEKFSSAVAEQFQRSVSVSTKGKAADSQTNTFSLHGTGLDDKASASCSSSTKSESTNQFRFSTHTRINSISLGVGLGDDLDLRLTSKDSSVALSAREELRKRVFQEVKMGQQALQKNGLRSSSNQASASDRPKLPISLDRTDPRWSRPKIKRVRGNLIGRVSRMQSEGQYEAVLTAGNVCASPLQFAQSILRDESNRGLDPSNLGGARDKPAEEDGQPEVYRSDWEKMFAGAVEIERLFGPGDNLQSSCFETVVSRVIQKFTRIANPLLKPRDAVVFQDAFFVRKTDSFNSDESEGANDPSDTNSKDDGKDKTNKLLEERMLQLKSQAKKLSQERKRYLSEIQAAEKILKAAETMKHLGSGELKVTNIDVESIQENVFVLKRAVEKIDSQSSTCQSLISDLTNPQFVSDKDAVSRFLRMSKKIAVSSTVTSAAGNIASSQKDSDNNNRTIGDNALSPQHHEGTFMIYEISVQHPECPVGSTKNLNTPNNGRRNSLVSSKLVRSEVLLAVYMVEPLNVINPLNMKTEGNCSVLTSILQLDPVGLPQWMCRSIVDSPAILGRSQFRVGVNYSELAKLLTSKRKKNSKKKSNGKTVESNISGIDLAQEEQRLVPHPKLYDYDILAVLGRGGYGKVLLVKNKNLLASGSESETRVLYAMKVIRKAILTKEKQIQRTILEKDILARATHPFVVNLKTAFQTPENLYMVMEFAQGGDLFTHLHRDGPFLEKRVKVYACEIILALEHLHSAGVIYRDLKPENILLDRQGHIKIVDFGLARAFSRKDTDWNKSDSAAKLRFPSSEYRTTSFAGTERYMAPEQLLQKSYSFAVDWFQFGITLCELLTRRHPFQGANHYQTMKHIVDAKYIPVLKVSRHMPPLSGEIVSFLDSLLQRNPARRLGAVVPDTGKVNAREHAWFSSIDWVAVIQRKLDPGFVPKVLSDEDVSNFDDVFTRETAGLSGEDALKKAGEDSKSVKNNHETEVRKKETWMNLWGLVGADGSEDMDDISNDSGSAQKLARQSLGPEGDIGSIPEYQTGYDAFEGFSFDAPSPMAAAIAETHGD